MAKEPVTERALPHATADALPADASAPDPTKSGKPDFATAYQALKWSAAIGVVSFLALYGSGQTSWAWGFLIGSLLSLFSFVTLAMAVPFLLWPGAPAHMVALLQVTLVMKLPIFCVGLYLTCNLRGVAPGASVFGICLVPGAITLRTLYGMVAESVRVRYDALKQGNVQTLHLDLSEDRGDGAQGQETPVEILNEILKDKSTEQSLGKPRVPRATTELAAE